MSQNEHILRLTTPYKDIFTTVYLIKTDAGALLFDAASWPSDISEYILPFLREAGVDAASLRYIFISHNHTDHSGGLKELCTHFPDACIVSRSPALKETFAGSPFLAPDESTTLLGCLRVVPIPGHTLDSAAIFDTRTSTLVSGDCLQQWGIFGSGKWGANIRYPAEHLSAIENLRALPIRTILTAHDYHPCGYAAFDAASAEKMLASCIEPFARIKTLLDTHPDFSDESIAELYNSAESTPTLGAHVVTALREALSSGTVSL